jgi:NitT/TauT family transport system permease protein/sulfonate transport system permease protein
MMPVLMSGMRVAYGICWKIALVAELFGAQSGLGYLLMRAQSSADASMVFAVCFMIVIAVITIDKLVLNPLAKHYSVNKGVSQ